MAGHTHKFAQHPELEDVTHVHKNGDKPHIHDGLADDAYLKRVADREKKAKKK